MLTIILAFIAVIVLFAILGFLSEITGGDGSILMPLGSTISAFIIALALFAGICFPLSGYNDWELQKEVELVSLSNSVETGSSGFLYVVRSSDNVYSYRYKIDSEFGTPTSTNYETDTVEGNVEEIEDPKCEVPVLRIYQKTAKRTKWTFGLMGETKYVFYVPDGTIQKEVKLK